MAKKNNTFDIRLSVIDYERPTAPTFDEVQVSPNTYVRYGAGNDFPEILQKYKRESATFGTIINGITDYIVGDGVEVLPALTSFSEKMNARGESAQDLVRQLAYDFVMFGGFAVQVIYTRMHTIAEVYALDFAKVRSNEYNDLLFYRKSWRAGGRMLKYPAFSRRNAVTNNEPSQIFYFKNGSRTTYPEPMYVGALKDIIVEIDCARYNLSSISRGFMARYIMNIPDDAQQTDDQKRAFEDKLKEKFCGATVDTNIMLYWGNGDERLSVERIDADDTNERYITTKKDARENIYTAFRATPNLFGLPSETTGFSSQEYGQSFKLFQKTVIAPMQRAIEQSFAKIFDVPEAIKIHPFTINFEE